MSIGTIIFLTAVVLIGMYIASVIMVNKRTCLAKLLSIDPDTDDNINKIKTLAEAIFTNQSITFAPDYEGFSDLSVHIIRKNGNISEVVIDSQKTCVRFNGDSSKTIVNKKQFSKTTATLFIFGTMCAIVIVFAIFLVIATGC